MATPRVLTFNFHEPYLCLMAKTGIPLTVGLFDKAPFARDWQTKFRPIPRTVTLVEERIWRRDLLAGHYDVVIAHNELNANDVYGAKASCLLVCHNRRNFLETTLTGDKEKTKAKYVNLLAKLQEEFAFIYISNSKKDSYGIPGTVILPGIDVEEYGGYTGEIAEVLRVGNAMRARNLMFDVDFQEIVCKGLPNRVIGEDPLIPAAVPSRSFEELLSYYRSLRCLLHVTREAYEDGYNLAMLEAMACGMPVVALANATSPITDGQDGFSSSDASALHRRLQELLADRDHAKTIGAMGRETVAAKFPIDAFTAKWRETIESAAERGPSHGTTAASQRLAAASKPGQSPIPQLNLLMEYFTSPLTTGRYIEEALRQEHNVFTIGMQVPNEMFRHWGFVDAPPPALPLDLPREAGVPYAQIMKLLPDSFKPHFFLWVDSGMSDLPADIESLGMPRICYMIDTHCMLEKRVEIARKFDFTFLAQQTFLGQFVEAGVKNVAWLPLACSPELHNTGPLERRYDVAFVGGIPDDPNDRRHKIIDRVAKQFPNHKIGRFWPHEMAQIYAQSKIVVNIAAAHDVNMRVFEALASGALLITDRADGLETLFVDGEHLAVYRNDDELVTLIDRYLNDEPARKRIAATGQELVLSEHTYAVRMRLMLGMVLEALGAVGGIAGESRFNFGGYYRCPRPELARQVPKHVARALDLGCGGGEFGLSLKKRGVAKVVGIEIVERAWKFAKQVLDDAILGNIEQMELPFEEGAFDCVICGDVLEHLVEPAKALRKLARVLEPEGLIVISIPNVRFWMTVLMHVSGRWKYEDAGIMDRTHLRFFCAEDLRELMDDGGFEILRLEPLSMWSPDALKRDAQGYLRFDKLTIGPLDDAEYQEFLVYQYIIVAAKKGVNHLALARRALDAQDENLALLLAEKAHGAVDEVERRRIMAVAFARIGNLDVAEKLYREAMRMAPENSSLGGDLGILLVARERPKDARRFLERAVEAQPDNERFLGALGLACLGIGDYDHAITHLQRALELDFDNGALVMHLIDAARKKSRLSDAVPYAKRYAEFYPGNANAAVAYAELLADLGETDQARDVLDTLLILAPDCTPARERLRALESASREAGR